VKKQPMQAESRTRVQRESHWQNTQWLGKDLMSIDDAKVTSWHIQQTDLGY
jgi:hypothetical protein